MVGMLPDACFGQVQAAPATELLHELTPSQFDLQAIRVIPVIAPYHSLRLLRFNGKTPKPFLPEAPKPLLP
jgi:hypothetical protein